MPVIEYHCTGCMRLVLEGHQCKYGNAQKQQTNHSDRKEKMGDQLKRIEAKLDRVLILFGKISSEG